MARYTARFHIDHGLSHGFGVVYDDESEVERELEASDPLQAIVKAESLAYGFARDYLPNESEGRTTVKLLCISDGEDEIDVFGELEAKLSDKEGWDDLKGRFEDGKYVISMNVLEKFFAREYS